jgi:hypothetical protein
MAGRAYQNFDLVLEELGGASYRARVMTSAHEDMPSIRFDMPFDARDLKLLLLTLDPGRSGTRRVARSMHTQAAEEFGGAMFEAVFAGDVRLAWHEVQQSARESGKGVRLRLRLGDAPSIAGLPWELLYDRRTNDYVAQSDRTPIIRYLDTGIPPHPIEVSGPLHILAVICSPYDLPELDVEREWRHLNEALAKQIKEGTIRLDRLPEPTTLDSLRYWLRKNDVHVLHFIGHGDFDARLDDGILYFCDEYGRSVAVSPETLGPHLKDHDALRLVLLNACQTARGDVHDAFGGMAQGLIQKQVDAVVAMQFPITDPAAAKFAKEFYGAIGDGLPVDQAATDARKAMMQHYGDEWATPVLFMRSKNGEIFTGIARNPAPPPPNGRDEWWRRARKVVLRVGVAVVVVAGAVTALVLGLPRLSDPNPNPSPSPSPSPVPTRTMTTTIFSVPGSQLWTVTPVKCVAGEPLSIRATGTVQHGPTKDRTSGPDGMNGEHLETNVVDDANHASLIGRIGEAGVPFNVGSALDTKCKADGVVYLGINDEGYVGNIGEFHAAIEHAQ